MLNQDVEDVEEMEEMPDLELASQQDSEVDLILPSRDETDPGEAEELVQDLVEELCRHRPPPPPPGPLDPVGIQPPERGKTSFIGAFFFVAFLITWATLD